MSRSGDGGDGRGQRPVKPAPFAYFRPRTLPELLERLHDDADDAKVLAGGQSLVAAMNLRLARPAILLDCNDLPELGFVRREDGGLRIGALTRHAAFHRPVEDGPAGRMLARVVRHIGHYPIRQRGTFGGSLAHADPSAEWCLVASVLGAEMTLRSHEGQRVVPADAFFHGTFTTALRPDELLTEIRLPDIAADWRYGFMEFSRRAGDFALTMALVRLKVTEGRVRAAQFGLGGVADRPVRLPELERQLVGQPAATATFAAIADAAALAVQPTEDIHATAALRRDLIRAMLTRAFTEAMT